MVLPSGGSLAEPLHARLLPQPDLVALHAWRHVSGRHKLRGLHLGENTVYTSDFLIKNMKRSQINCVLSWPGLESSLYGAGDERNGLAV